MVVQVETVGWSADSPNLTDEELKWEAERYAEICALIEKKTLHEFSPTPYRPVGKQGRDEMRVSEWMDRDRPFNVVAHQHVPYNTHWNTGAYPFKEVCEEITHILKQTKTFNSKAMPEKEDLSERGKNPFPEVPALNLKPPSDSKAPPPEKEQTGDALLREIASLNLKAYRQAKKLLGEKNEKKENLP